MSPTIRRTRISHPRDLVDLMHRHLEIGVAVAALTILVAVLAYLLLPRSYASEAQLLVRVGRESVRPDPTVTLGPTLGVNQSRENELNSELTILQSEDLFRSVASDLYDDPDKQETAVAALGKNLRINLPAASNVIHVQYRSREPERARDILNKVIEQYLDKHLRSHGTPGSAGFFERQSADVGRRIDEVRKRLQTALAKLGAADLDTHRASLLNRLEALTQARDAALRDSRVSRAKLAQLETGILSLDGMQVLEEFGGPSAARDEIERYLTTLRLQEQKLTANYHPDTTVVRDLREQIRLAEAAMADESRDRVTVRRGINTNRQSLELQRLNERTNLAGLESQIKILEAELVDVRNQLGTLTAQEGQLVGMLSEINVLETERQKYLAGLERTRIDLAMSADRISNIRIVQAPTLPRSPSGPPRIWILIVGLLLAGTGGIGAVVLADFFDPSFQEPEDIRARLGLPVLARLPLHDDLRVPIARRLEIGRRLVLPAGTQQELGYLVGHILATKTPSPVIALTATQQGVGTSTLTFHLAARLAGANLGPVLLVDGSDSRDNLTNRLGLDITRKLVDIGIPGLSILPRWQENCDFGTLQTAIESHRPSMAFILIDLPPATQSGTALRLADAAHHTLLVLAPGSDPATAQRNLRILEKHGVSLLGSTLTRQELKRIHS